MRMARFDSELGLTVAHIEDVLTMAMTHKNIPASQVTKAQMRACLRAINWAVRRHLAAQMAVGFDGLGLLYPRIRTYKRGDRSKRPKVGPADISDKVSRIVVGFRVSAAVRRELDEALPGDVHDQPQRAIEAHGESDDGEESGR
jgi:hypothetical protein